MTYLSPAGSAWLAAFGLAVSLLLAGCGKSPEAGTVSLNGTVTLDGKPIDQASVAFIGNNGARLASATTDKAGKFTIRAALGKNAVAVSKASPAPVIPATEEPQLMPTEQEYAKLQQAAKSEIPAKYADPKTSGLSIDVTEGMQDVELALSSK